MNLPLLRLAAPWLGLALAAAANLAVGALFDRLAEESAQPRTVTFQWPVPEELQGKFNLDPEAPFERVYVAGFFNAWTVAEEAYRLEAIAPGVWRGQIPVGPGANQYKFVAYLPGRDQAYWLHDLAADELWDDNFAGLNSVLLVPDYEGWGFVAGATLWGLWAVAFLVLTLNPVLVWFFRQRLSFRVKLMVSTLVMTVLSSVVFVWQAYREYPGIIQQGLIDSLHWLHNTLAADGIDFNTWSEPATVEQARRSTDRVFGRARTRVEATNYTNQQITLADLVFLGPSGELLAYLPREENRRLQETRASRYGFDSAQSYFEQGILSPLIERARRGPPPRDMLLSRTPEAYLTDENPITLWNLRVLGFNTFLHPIRQGGRLLGYYAGDIQVKLYGGVIQRLFGINLFLLGLTLLLTALLFLNLGRRVTGSLETLTEWTHRILKGDFESRRELPSRDEFQRLSQNFDAMRLGLKESFATIADQNFRLKEAAYADRLTGLPNRQKLLEDLARPRTVGLALLNIDSFREINNSFGVEVGDFILREMGARLASALEPEETLYKIGPDEFVLLDHKVRSLSDFEARGQVWLDLVQKSGYAFLENEFFVSASAGLAQYRINEGEEALYQPSLLLSQADMALRRAKRSPQRLVSYRPSMALRREYKANILWTNKLRRALEEDRVRAFFQPLVANPTGRRAKYECLVRLIEPEGNVVSPQFFLAIAQKSRLYRRITTTMLSQAFAVFRHRKDEFTVNLSQQDLNDAATLEFLRQLLDREPETARRFWVEIVETDGIDNYEKIRDFFAWIRPYGVRVAIDDFGSGYSNFEHLLQLKVDCLKIDATLIRSLDLDPHARIITRTIVQFAKDLGIATVAEYVHSEAVQAQVEAFGIEFSQGYLWGEPKAEPAPDEIALQSSM